MVLFGRSLCLELEEGEQKTKKERERGRSQVPGDSAALFSELVLHSLPALRGCQKSCSPAVAPSRCVRASQRPSDGPRVDVTSSI